MGKLVPQDAKDEPASELLKKVAAAKAKLVKGGEIKRQKPIPFIVEEEKLFNLPTNWIWTKLGNISLLRGGFAYKSGAFISSSKYQVIRMGNIRPGLLRIGENPVFITEEIAGETMDYTVSGGDILLTMTGTKGKRDYLYSVIVHNTEIKGNSLFLNQRLCNVRAVGVSANYLILSLSSSVLLDPIYNKSTGTANQANIGMEAISNWVIPLPPLAEQHRIVAKVDELMSLCDRLKVRLQNAQATQLHLADSLVEAAIS
jgi:type I restriction enzyme S subunit